MLLLGEKNWLTGQTSQFAVLAYSVAPVERNIWPINGHPLTCLHGSWQVPTDRNGSELVPMIPTQESAEHLACHLCLAN